MDLSSNAVGMLSYMIAFVFQFILGQLWYGVFFRDLVKKFLVEQKKWPIDWRNFSMFNAFTRTIIGNYLVIFAVGYFLTFVPSDLTEQLKATSLLALLTFAVSLHHSGWEGRSLASIFFHESFHVLYFAAIPTAKFLVENYF